MITAEEIHERLHFLRIDIERLQQRQVYLRKNLANAKIRSEQDELRDRLLTVSKRLQRANNALTQSIVDDYKEERRREYAHIKPD